GNLVSKLRAGSIALKVRHAESRPQEARDGMEWALARVGLAEGGVQRDPACGGLCREFADQPALADSGSAHQQDDAAVALDRTFEDALDGGQFPAAADQGRFSDIEQIVVGIELE